MLKVSATCTGTSLPHTQLSIKFKLSRHVIFVGYYMVSEFTHTVSLAKVFVHIIYTKSSANLPSPLLLFFFLLFFFPSFFFWLGGGEVLSALGSPMLKLWKEAISWGSPPNLPESLPPPCCLAPCTIWHKWGQTGLHLHLDPLPSFHHLPECWEKASLLVFLDMTHWCYYNCPWHW